MNWKYYYGRHLQNAFGRVGSAASLVERTARIGDGERVAFEFSRTVDRRVRCAAARIIAIGPAVFRVRIKLERIVAHLIEIFINTRIAYMTP